MRSFDNSLQIEYNVPIVRSKHTPMTSKADNALEHVHNLYLMQFKMLDLLQQDLQTPEARREARENMKEFQSLLRKADWRYMGGEDVWEALKTLPKEMDTKLKTSRVSVKGVKKKR